MSEKRPITFLCLASDYKGVPFLLEAKAEGCRVLLLVAAEFANRDWPWQAIDERFIMPDLAAQPNILHAVSYLMRTEKIDRIVALDDYDVATAATLREHLRLPGIGASTARYFRDKLAMRMRAQEAGLLVPPFTAVFNDAAVNRFLAEVPAPWVLKPRSEAGAIGIRKLDSGEAVWAALHGLGDDRSYYLLEQFLPGNVYHVDSILAEGDLLFALASQYGTPPLSVMQGGGIFTTRTLAPGAESAEILAQNRRLLLALGNKHGVAHTEFIKAQEDGRFYFLETAARVGGANIDRLVKEATGLDLWTEVARIEIALARGHIYKLPAVKTEHAGLITCLARQENPDLSAYADPEVKWRMPKAYHAGLLLASPDAQRTEQLLNEYSRRFAQDFLAVQPPKKKVRTSI